LPKDGLAAINAIYWIAIGLYFSGAGGYFQRMGSMSTVVLSSPSVSVPS
jgi:hypothetical protein